MPVTNDGISNFQTPTKLMHSIWKLGLGMRMTATDADGN